MFADYDNDGRIDMFVTVNGQQVEDGKGNTIYDENQGKGILFQNQTKTKNNWVKIRLEVPNQIVMLMAHPSLSL